MSVVAERPVIAFLTDYGLADDFVGVCHGVILNACPQATIIDVTHGIPRQDVRSGALVLARALPYLPVGVGLAVVDPGVGGPRRAVAVACADGRFLVAPDNGLLAPAIAVAGGASAAVDLVDSSVALRPVSATFHGRDVFAPAAAALGAGATLQRIGTPIDPATLVGLELPRPRVQDGALVVHVLTVDGFGNLALDATRDDLTTAGLDRPQLRVGDVPVRAARTFADVAPGELLLHADGYGSLALAVNRGSAAQRLAVGVDAELRISAP
jgi:S-adenosylmethionine hydrolase